MSDAQSLPVSSKELSDRINTHIGKVMNFIEELEKDVYDVTKFPKMGRGEKLELLEQAKKSLIDDLNFSHKVYMANKEMDRETLMLLSIIQSLPNELRTVVATQIKDILVHKEKYLKGTEEQ
jgi:hypothetical protein